MSYKEIEGDLLKMVDQFDVICQGVNCFNTQGAGISKGMIEMFGTDKYEMEARPHSKGDYSKLGNIDWNNYEWDVIHNQWSESPDEYYKLTVINCYIQYYYRGNHPNGPGACCVDYIALAMCMRKINHIFKGRKIGLPTIGAGLANGDWLVIQNIIKQELKDMDVTIVKYKKQV